MRARRKKHLLERLDEVNELLLAKEYYGFYDLPEIERYNIIDYKKVFDNDNPVVLEIGAGKGKFANTFATTYKNLNVLAVEKISNVIIDACESTKKLGIKNVKYLNASAENLKYYVKNNSIENIYLNFSCPYPKKTYANRRLTYKTYLEIYKTLLKKGGKIFLKTDNYDFFEFSKESLQNNGFLVFDVCYDLHNTPQFNKENILTEYEQKFLEENKKIMRLTASIKD